MPKAARVTDTHAAPHHDPTAISPPGQPTVLIGGQPAARVTDSVSGGGTIVAGENTVLIGGQPAARQGDPTSHGGSITSGCDTVLIGKPPSANSPRPALEQCTCKGDPINVATGQVYATAVDIVWSKNITLTRTYASDQREYHGLFGWGWRCCFDMQLSLQAETVILIDNTGREIDWPLAAGPQFNLAAKWLLTRHDQTFEVIDSNRQQHYLFHWPSGSLMAWRYPQGELRCYYENQQLKLIRTANGQHYWWYYNSAGLVTAITQETIPLCTYHYDHQGHLLKSVDKQGASQCYAYDAQHRLTQTTNRLGYRFYYRYDNQHRGVETYGQDGAFHRHFTYEAGKTTVTRTDAQSTIYHHNAFGLVTQKINAFGQVQRYEYDRHLQLIREIDAHGGSIYYRYDTQGRLLAKIDPDNHRLEYAYSTNTVQERYPGGRSVNKVYDAQRRLVQVTDCQGNQKQGNYNGELISKPSRSIVARSYDQYGRLAVEQHRLGAKRSYTYGGLSKQVIDFDGTVTRYDYDAERHLTQIVYPAGATRQLAYNAWGQRVQQVDENGQTLTSRYDLEGRLTTLINELGSAHHFDYDVVGRLQRDQDIKGVQRHYAYDAVGNLVTMTDSVGRVYQLTYSPTGRLLQIVGRDVDNSVSVLHYEYERSGLLVAARNDYQSVRLVYDDLGRVVEEVQGDFGVKSAYDAQGNLAQLETTWETSIQLAYDEHNQLRQVVFPHGQVVEYHRDALGRPSERRLPGGITSRCEHDLMNRLVAQRVYRGDKPIVERYYEYDAMGRLVRCEGSQPGAYEYDKAGQLIAAHYPHGEEHFQYDAAGNRETVSTDECGRVAGRGSDRYYYDVFNQLVRIERSDGTTIHYRYDALGRRISKQVGT
ncbi:MAG: hypothetical protein HC877_07290 [Thioploca sp.]|nr:hypothetical protein [Thioploca sp.]